VFAPYSVACVAKSFASSGTTLLNVFSAKTAARVGYAELAPNHDGIAISISVLVDSAHAAATAAGIRVMDRQLHRSTLILQDHNLLIEYRNAPDERARVGRAIRRVRRACGG
jgi:hypothetical protein